MTWNIEFLEEAKKDLKKLDHSVQLQYHIITYQKDCHRRKITFFANVPVLLLYYILHTHYSAVSIPFLAPAPAA